MDNTYDAFITIAKASNINMESLYAYYKAIKTEAIKTEAIKTEAVKTEEVKTEEAKIEEVKTKKGKTKFIKMKSSWADEDPEDNDFWFSKENKSTQDLSKIQNLNVGKSYKDIAFPSIKQNTPVKAEEVKAEKVKTDTKTEEAKDEWESFPAEDEFVKVEKKAIKKTTKKAIQKPFVKNDLEMIYSLEEFLECIRDGLKPNVDFVISEDAHCPHTFEGTLCKNIKTCKMIHIQRCMYGETCGNKKCPFLHKSEMNGYEAKQAFCDTMKMYNKIKNDKQVKNFK